MPVLPHVRVDNRLLHGQIVQFWIPHLNVVQLVVADDDIAANESMPAIYRMALPASVDLKVIPVCKLRDELAVEPGKQTMVLLGEVFDAARAMMCGAEFSSLTLGNIHATAGRSRVTDAVYLSQEELQALVHMHSLGMEIEIQTFPAEILRLTVNAEGAGVWAKC